MIKSCVFCKSNADWIASPSARDATLIVCPVCVGYEVTRMELHDLEKRELPTSQRINVVAQTIEDANSGLQTIWAGKSVGQIEKPYIVRNVGDYASLPILHASKPDEVLKLVAKKLRNKNPFEIVRFSLQDAYLLRMDGFKEMQRWLKILVDERFLENEEFLTGTITSNVPDIAQFPFRPTSKAWARVEKLFQDINSRKVFIAMSFGHEERSNIQTAIEDACRKTGWEAGTIDKKEHINGITDEIIASINGSRFVVAEFTGNNHGVYYEAGYAAGKGIPVILVVKKSQLDDPKQGVHFDVRHINHIVWENYQDLTTKLINRINAVIT